MTDDRIKFIVKFCIGSNFYKYKHHKEFEHIVKNFDVKLLCKILSKLHLLGIFYDISSVYNNTRLRQYISPFIKVENLLSNILFKELQVLRKNANPSITPILLKGISLWDKIYERKYNRKIDDLDILIPQISNIENFCRTLELSGYQNIENNYRRQIYDTMHYELSSFIKIINIKLEPNLSSFLIDILKNKDFEKIRINHVSGEEYSTDIRVEVHKSIFIYEDNTYPQISKFHFSNYTILKGYKKLDYTVMLPYTAFKFCVDVESYNNGGYLSVKCIKLVNDFIRILKKISNEKFYDSITLSKKLNLDSYYFNMLFSIQELVPEISIKGFSRRHNINYLDIFFKKLLKQNLK